MTYKASPTFLALLYCCYFLSLSSLVLSRQAQSPPYPFNAPNKYIQSSPPCLAAKCKDGIALLAVHVREYESEDSQFDDLLLDNIGPIRIEQLDHNAVLLNSGWRVDGHVLVDKGRDLCDQDSTLYGYQKDKDYAKRLGWGLVDRLVECHVKDSTRSLATAGLLATNLHGGELYLVDTTGLYPCRALAIGSHAKDINACLESIDFCVMSVEDGVQKLLQILRDCRDGKGKDGGDGNELWHIPNETVVEIAMIMIEGRGIHRKREVFLAPSLDESDITV
jgi:20S proteasome alpha/beta subunit